MDIKSFIHDSLKNLKALGIDATSRETVLTKAILGMPKDMLEDLEKEQILGLLLDYMGMGIRDEESGTMFRMSEQIYSFDMEVSDIEQMYTLFLKGLSELLKEDFVFTDIEEDIGKVDFESGTGVQTIRFQCNGKACQYDAKVEYDWFDAGMLAYMNQVIEEQHTGKYLYAASDGWQNCILFYQTEEWSERFGELLGIALKKV